MTSQKVAGQMALPLVPGLSATVRAGLVSRVQPGWQTHAACTGSDPGLFDPPADDPVAGPTNAARARAICHDCPARRSCLFTALLRDEHGIWGGHDDDSRDRIREALDHPARRDTVLGPDPDSTTPRQTKEAA